MRDFFRRAAAPVAIIATALFGLLPPSRSAADGGDSATTVAIIDFSYIDTSGEVADQHSAHAAQLAEFMTALRRDFAAKDKFRLVVPRCHPGPCSATDTPEADLQNAAGDAGARLLVIGSVHKMSTLVQWAKVEAIDVRNGRVVLDKLFTFRGDTDDAWRRAEAFIFDEVSQLGG